MGVSRVCRDVLIKFRSALPSLSHFQHLSLYVAVSLSLLYLHVLYWCSKSTWAHHVRTPTRIPAHAHMPGIHWQNLNYPIVCLLSLGSLCMYVYTLIIIHLLRQRGARYADGVFADEYSITGSKHYVNKHHKNY
jgi:hypothetical protein